MESLDDFTRSIADRRLFTVGDLRGMLSYAAAAGHNAAHPKTRALIDEIARREMVS